MKTKFKCIHWLVLAGAAASGPLLHAAPFQNGSFEANGGNQSTTVTGWALSSTTNGLFALNTHGATDGNFSIGFDAGNVATGTTTLSQSFTTTPLQVYRVTLDFGALSFSGATSLSRLQVEARDGVSISSGAELILPASGTLTGTTGGSLNQNTNVIQMSDSSGASPIYGAAPNGEFSSVSFLFTAQSANTTLIFTDLSTGGNDTQDAALDNVRIATVPEPGVNTALLSAGVGTLCVVLRRRDVRPVMGN